MTHPVDMQEHFPDLVKSACVMQAGHSLFDGPDARSRGNQAARATLSVRASRGRDKGAIEPRALNSP
jgi:hypothetical protein